MCFKVWFIQDSSLFRVQLSKEATEPRVSLG